MYLPTKDVYECITRAYSPSIWQHKELEKIAQEQEKKLAKLIQERRKELEKIAQERKKKAREEATLRAAAVTEFHELVDKYREKDAEHAAVERRKEEAEIRAAEAHLKARMTQTRPTLAAAQARGKVAGAQANKASASAASAAAPQSPPGANAKVGITKEDFNAAKAEVAADLNTMMTEQVALKHRDRVSTDEAEPMAMQTTGKNSQTSLS